MSYILCDMDCDQEINKSDLEEHCSDCLCVGELADRGQQDMPATKAWRSTSVVEGRGHPNTLSSRRSHRRKKNRRGSGMLNRRKVKLNKKVNRKWRWKNKWRIKLLKLQKALSSTPEPPGINIPNNGTLSTDFEARKDVVSGSLNLDLAANTESSDGEQYMETTQQGTRTRAKNPPRRDTKKRAEEPFSPAQGSHPPLQEGGAAPSAPESSSRWLNTKRDQPPRTRRAKHVYPNQKLKWSRQIGGHLNYTDSIRCPQGPIRPMGPKQPKGKAVSPDRIQERTGEQRTTKHPTDKVTRSTSQIRVEGYHRRNWFDGNRAGLSGKQHKPAETSEG